MFIFLQKRFFLLFKKHLDQSLCQFCGLSDPCPVALFIFYERRRCVCTNSRSYDGWKEKAVAPGAGSGPAHLGLLRFHHSSFSGHSHSSAQHISVCLYWIGDLPLSPSLSLSLSLYHTHTSQFDPFRLWFSGQDYHWHRIDGANLGRWHTARISHALFFLSSILSFCRAVVIVNVSNVQLFWNHQRRPVLQFRVVQMLRPECAQKWSCQTIPCMPAHVILGPCVKRVCATAISNALLIVWQCSHTHLH